MHSEAVIERVRKFDCRLTFSEIADALGDRHRVNSEMLLQGEIERTERSTWRP